MLCGVRTWTCVLTVAGTANEFHIIFTAYSTKDVIYKCGAHSKNEHKGYRILVGKGDKIKQDLYEDGKGNISKMTKERKDWEVYFGVAVKNTKKKTIN